MNKPNFFIIWEPKCGTTIIHHYLSQHPQIFMSDPKEPHHFDTDLDRLASVRNFDKYLKLFSKANKSHKIIGEATPGYAKSKAAAKNIYEFNPDAKILYIIREPVSYLQSWHKQSLKSWRTMEKDFINFLDRNKNKWFYYLKKIDFSSNIWRYIKLFPKNNIKVIIYEEFKKNNQETITEITNFLNIDNIKIDRHIVNISWIPRFPILNKFFHNPMIRCLAWKIIPLKYRTKWNEFIHTKLFLKQKDNSKIDLSNDAKIKLMKECKDNVIKINDLLKKNKLLDQDIDLVKYRWYDSI